MSEQIRGYCPACGGESLFLGSGGYITCSRSDCRRPDAASDILADREIQHVVVLRVKDFTVRHPLRERLDGDLEACEIHQRITSLDGPPRSPGTYRVYTTGGGDWTWEPLS